MLILTLLKPPLKQIPHRFAGNLFLSPPCKGGEFSIGMVQSATVFLPSFSRSGNFLVLETEGL
ncbi:MAG: hypothetical protein DWQ06_11915 [Calditrichaeota bacterium]|nr:MAG: hypothetical protein DWQ06_11915 [Calditrichota bacterium]